MRFQSAQKFHAVSDPHDPPGSINDRAPDIVDLLLLRDLTNATGNPELAEIRSAGEAVFEGRAREAEELGLPSAKSTAGLPRSTTRRESRAEDPDREGGGLVGLESWEDLMRAARELWGDGVATTPEHSTQPPSASPASGTGTQTPWSSTLTRTDRGQTRTCFGATLGPRLSVSTRSSRADAPPEQIELILSELLAPV